MRTVYNYFRDYDPDSGRYIESDPLGLKGGDNLYAYTYGNPQVFFDNTGNVPVAIMAIGGIMGGVCAYMTGGDAVDVVIGTLTGMLGPITGLTMSLLKVAVDQYAESGDISSAKACKGYVGEGIKTVASTTVSTAVDMNEQIRSATKNHWVPPKAATIKGGALGSAASCAAEYAL